MKISDIDIHVCKQESSMNDQNMRGGQKSELEFIVIQIHTDEGITGTSMGYAGSGAQMAAHTAAANVKPWLVGKDPTLREALWEEHRVQDRWWGHSPIFTYGPFDIALWDILAKRAGLPLHELLGGYQRKIPTYASSLVLDSPEAYAEEALEVKDAGLQAYKLHPPGKVEFDIEAYRACREAVGDDYRLMADPVAAYTYEQALRIGRVLEELEYYWYEEPLWDTDFYNLKKLTDKLDIPVCGTEVLKGSHFGTAQCIQQHIIDIVRTDVSWKGGITPVMKTAHLAESFGIQCEIHTAIYHPLELVNLHCACAVPNCEYFEILWPRTTFDFGLQVPINIDNEGYAHLPDGPGMGIEMDWHFIKESTVEIL